MKPSVMITGSRTEEGFVKVPLQVELDFGKGYHVSFHMFNTDSMHGLEKDLTTCCLTNKLFVFVFLLCLQSIIDGQEVRNCLCCSRKYTYPYPQQKDFWLFLVWTPPSFWKFKFSFILSFTISIGFWTPFPLGGASGGGTQNFLYRVAPPRGPKITLSYTLYRKWCP